MKSLGRLQLQALNHQRKRMILVPTGSILTVVNILEYKKGSHASVDHDATVRNVALAELQDMLASQSAI